MRPRLIAMGFDDAYTAPALVTLFSARKSFSGMMRLLVAYEEKTLSHDSKMLVQEVCGALKIEVSFEKLTLPSHLIGSGHITSIAWARILLMSKLGEEFLWLDCDLIMLPGWESLILQDFFEEGKGIVAALDLSASTASSHNAAYSAAGKGYINTGVLLVKPSQLNLDFLTGISESMVRYQELGFQWLDQDVLNYNLEGQSGLFPQELNRQVEISALMQVSGVVLHFIGSAKPWLGPFRLAYFWSFPVRIWSNYARGLRRALASDPNLKKSVSDLHKKVSRAESLNWGDKPATHRVLLALSRFVWR